MLTIITIRRVYHDNNDNIDNNNNHNSNKAAIIVIIVIKRITTISMTIFSKITITKNTYTVHACIYTYVHTYKFLFFQTATVSA